MRRDEADDLVSALLDEELWSGNSYDRQARRSLESVEVIEGPDAAWVVQVLFRQGGTPWGHCADALVDHQGEACDAAKAAGDIAQFVIIEPLGEVGSPDDQGRRWVE